MTAVNVIDSYHMGIVSPQPVVNFYTLGTVEPEAPAEAPAPADGGADPVADGAEEAKPQDAEAETKVVKAPSRQAAKATEGVETK